MTESFYEDRSVVAELRPPPRSHVSIELGHLYAQDYKKGPESVAAHLRSLQPYKIAAVAEAQRRYGTDASISTCMLVDDYFTREEGLGLTPAELIAMVQSAVAEADLGHSTTWCASA